MLKEYPFSKLWSVKLAQLVLKRNTIVTGTKA